MTKDHSDLADLQAELARVEQTVRRLIARRETGKRGEEPEPWEAVDLEAETIDRTILLLAAGPAVSPDKWDNLCSASNDNGCCPDLCADLLRADDLQRLLVYARVKALTEGDLIRLVPWDGTGGPKALATSEMRITRQGLARLVGDEDVPTLREHDDHRLLQPGAELDDLVLPAPTKRTLLEVIDAAKHRHLVLGDWGLGTKLVGGRCVTVLFYGPSGVAKTHSAEALAHNLGRPILTGLGPGLLSRWVGGTEENLGQIFHAAREQDAVLLLDEIDHLGMERGARRASRHDDGAVNTLLHLLDRHDGLVVMATNRPEVLDHALRRRVMFEVEFTRPDAKARAKIWEKMLKDVPTESDIDYGCLARHDLVGGEIRSVVLRAAFQAAARGEKVSQMLLCRMAKETAVGRSTSG